MNLVVVVKDTVSILVDGVTFTSPTGDEGSLTILLDNAVRIIPPNGIERLSDEESTGKVIFLILTAPKLDELVTVEVEGDVGGPAEVFPLDVDSIDVGLDTPVVDLAHGSLLAVHTCSHDRNCTCEDLVSGL